MLLIFIYTPAVVLLPFLLIIGSVLVLVPGGFIIVVGAAYYVSLGVIGLVGLASTALRRPFRAEAEESIAHPGRSGVRSQPGLPREAVVAAPVVAPASAFGSAQAASLAAGPRSRIGASP